MKKNPRVNEADGRANDADGRALRGFARAFTLMELLLVVTIVIIFTGLALTTFGGSKEKVALSLAADNLVTEIQKVQSFVRTGYLQDLDARSACYIVEFSKNNKPEFWNGVPGDGGAGNPRGDGANNARDFCEKTGPVVNLNIDPDLIVKKIEIGATGTALQETSGAKLSIIPPHGEIKSNPDGKLLTVYVSLTKDGQSVAINIDTESNRIYSR